MQIYTALRPIWPLPEGHEPDTRPPPNFQAIEMLALPGAGRASALAFVGHVQHLDAGGAVEDLSVEMMRGADAAAGIGYFARVLAHEIDKCRERSRRDARVDHQARRVVGDRGDRREVLDDVERGLLILNAVDRLRERNDDADGGAVGRRAPEHAHADCAR